MFTKLKRNNNNKKQQQQKKQNDFQAAKHRRHDREN